MVSKRKSPSVPQENQASYAIPTEWDEAAVKEAATAAAATSFGGPRKRFVGVRQRPSGRWVAEIKDTVQKIRVWLGTFDTAEAAARAYDEAACLLRGPNTRTNFCPRSPSNPSAPPALPPNISNLLLKLKAKNSPSKNSTRTAPPPTTTSTTIDFSVTSTEFQQQQVQQKQQYIKTDLESIDEFRFADFLNDQSFFPTSSNTAAAAAAAATTSPSYSSGDDSYMGRFTEGSCCAEQEEKSPGGLSEEEEIGGGPVDFRFVDNMEGLPGFFSPFEIAEESAVGSMETGEESSMFGAAAKRMKYERRISASLYALNGISECLRLRRGGLGDHLSELSNSCKTKKLMFEMDMVEGEAEQVQADNQQSQIQFDSSSSSSSSFLSDDGELSLWNSLDLPPICWVS